MYEYDPETGRILADTLDEVLQLKAALSNGHPAPPPAPPPVKPHSKAARKKRRTLAVTKPSFELKSKRYASMLNRVNQLSARRIGTIESCIVTVQALIEQGDLPAREIAGMFGAKAQGVAGILKRLRETVQARSAKVEDFISVGKYPSGDNKGQSYWKREGDLVKLRDWLVADMAAA